MRYKYFLAGFTLLEIMLYIALLSGLLVGVWVIVFRLMASAGQNTNELHRQADVEFVINKLHWAGLGASSVQTLDNSISFQHPDLGIVSPVTVSLLLNNTLVIQQGNGEMVELLPGYHVHAPDASSAFTFDNNIQVLVVRLVINGMLIERHITFP